MSVLKSVCIKDFLSIGLLKKQIKILKAHWQTTKYAVSCCFFLTPKFLLFLIMV